MAGSISAGTNLSATVTTQTTNSFFTCETKNPGGWLGPKTISTAAQVKVENGTYAVSADLNSGFCGYKILSVDLSIKPLNAKFSNSKTLLVDSPMAGIAGYDDIRSISSLDCPITQTSSTGLGSTCSVVKTDGTESSTDNANMSSAELNGTIHLNISTH